MYGHVRGIHVRERLRAWCQRCVPFLLLPINIASASTARDILSMDDMDSGLAFDIENDRRGAGEPQFPTMFPSTFGGGTGNHWADIALGRPSSTSTSESSFAMQDGRPLANSIAFSHTTSSSRDNSRMASRDISRAASSSRDISPCPSMASSSLQSEQWFARYRQLETINRRLAEENAELRAYK